MQRICTISKKAGDKKHTKHSYLKQGLVETRGTWKKQKLSW